MKVVRYILQSAFFKICNAKTGSVILIMLSACLSNNIPLRKFAEAVNYPVSWCVFPFMAAKNVFLSLFWLGIVYVNSDVPFFQHVNMYQMVRTGRSWWAFSHILGIFIRSVVLTILTAGSSVITLLPHIEFSNEWGKGLRTVASTAASQEYQLKYTVYYEIFDKFTPLEFMGLSILVITLIAAFLGIMMFLVSLYMNRLLAVIAGGALAAMLFFVVNLHPKIRYVLARFVPTVWGKLAQAYTPHLGYYWFPSVSYILIFLTTGIFLMTVLIYLKTQKMEFLWEGEDD